MDSRFDRRVLAPLLVLLAWPWAVHLQIVVLSALHLRPLADRSASIAILVIATAAAAWLAQRAWSRASSSQSDHRMPILARIAVVCMCAGAALSLLWPLALAVSLPVVAYDALWYRLPTIAQWLDAGRLAWVSSDDPSRNGYPLGQEAVSAVVSAATGSFQLTDVTSYLYVVCGALSLWLLAEACRVRRPLSLLAGAVFVLAPMSILNAGSGYVDAAFAGATVSFLCMAALCATTVSVDRLAFAALGMAAAHVLALKGTGLAFWLAVACSLTLAEWLRARPASWTRASRPRLPRWRALGLALALSLPGAFWCARDLFHTGNPLWPVRISIAGHTLLPGLGDVDHILDVANNTPAELAQLSELDRVLTAWLQTRGPATVFDSRLSGLGWAWPCFAIPAVLWFSSQQLRQRRKHAEPLAWLIGFTVLCFALQPMRWWSRYTLWLWGAGALALAVEAEFLTRRGHTRTVGLLLCCVGALTLSEASVALSHANGTDSLLVRWFEEDARFAERPADPRRPINADRWIAPQLWSFGFDHESDVCRGAFKPDTDDAIVDGVFAQLSPRPRVHVVLDDDGDWKRVRATFRAAGCSQLLLLRGSPALVGARNDPSMSVEAVDAFDPLFVVRPSASAALLPRP